ncbi:Hsp20/alpha crystallin family protein [Bradyrhizobium sp. USDA 10063]
MIKPTVPVTTDRNVARREANPFAFLQQEIDRLFDGFSRNFPAFSAAGRSLPSMDVSETDKTIEITAELPGLEQKDVELNLADNLLTIRGEKKNEREEKNKDYHLVERSFGSFARSVELPVARKSRRYLCRDFQGRPQGDRAQAGAQAKQADRDQDGGVTRKVRATEVIARRQITSVSQGRCAASNPE